MFRNLATRSGGRGRQAILDAKTGELTRILPHVGMCVKRFLGDKMAADVEGWITEIWKHGEESKQGDWVVMGMRRSHGHNRQTIQPGYESAM